ncbi:MAG: hypothetical protein NC341_13580 [Blautia sp.]|nr:hypothetical protein [Blautia sp.]MCM1200110.1 hypothetical protein [Bacteroides fragilis]
MLHSRRAAALAADRERSRGRRMDGKESYFQAALSDFTFDVAAGGAIRHLTDRGYSVEQIMRELSYPVPRARVEKAVYRHMLEARILLPELPAESGTMRIKLLRGERTARFPEMLAEAIAESGEENAYMECPFGAARQAGKGHGYREEKRLEQLLACLTNREREYLLGILWEKDIMYHRLNDRMREIGLKLVRSTEEEWKFYFLQKSR